MLTQHPVPILPEIVLWVPLEEPPFLLVSIHSKGVTTVPALRAKMFPRLSDLLRGRSQLKSG